MGVTWDIRNEARPPAKWFPPRGLCTAVPFSQKSFPQTPHPRILTPFFNLLYLGSGEPRVFHVSENIVFKVKQSALLIV